MLEKHASKNALGRSRAPLLAATLLSWLWLPSTPRLQDLDEFALVHMTPKVESSPEETSRKSARKSSRSGAQAAGSSQPVLAGAIVPSQLASGSGDPSVAIAVAASVITPAQCPYVKEQMRWMRFRLHNQRVSPDEVQSQMQEVWLGGVPQGPMYAEVSQMLADVEAEVQAAAQATLGELAGE